MQKAVVIIPTYNEHDNIAKMIPTLLEVFSNIHNWEMHIAVVDDTSPDKTYEVVEEFAKKHANVHLVLNKVKSGLGGAYLRGMEYAFHELDADAVFEFDADFSHDPQKIPELLKELDNGADMVLGSRYVKGGSIPQNWGLHRKFLSVFGNIVIMSVLTDFRIKDWTAGYRAITKKVYEAVSKEMHSERFSGYTFQIGFLHKAVRKGFVIKEVPIQFVDRTIGKSKLGPEYLKNTLLYICKVRLIEILSSRIFKFLMVGGIGTLVQLITLQIFRAVLPPIHWLIITKYLLATFLSVEIAIASNFALNNIWTFADRKISIGQIPLKFLHFNLSSAGSIIIQLIVATVGEKAFGIVPLFMIPVIHKSFDSGTLYVMIGIIIGLFWNFFAYNAFVWKKK